MAKLDRIGARAAPSRRHTARRPSGERPRVGRGHRDHTLGGGEQRIAGETSDMALAEHGGRGDVLGLRLLDGIAHRAVGDGVAKTPIAVDHCRGRGFLRDHPWRLWNDVAGLDAIDVLRDQNDPVGVMPHQIGADVISGDGRGFLGRCAGGDQQADFDLGQAFGGDGWHGFLPSRTGRRRYAIRGGSGQSGRGSGNVPARRLRTKERAMAQSNLYAGVAGYVRQGRSGWQGWRVQPSGGRRELGATDQRTRTLCRSCASAQPERRFRRHQGRRLSQHRRGQKSFQRTNFPAVRQIWSFLVRLAEPEAGLRGRFADLDFPQRGYRRDVEGNARSRHARPRGDAVRLPGHADGATSEESRRPSSPRWK